MAGSTVRAPALAGSVTLVTGGSRGIGRLVDQALADAGIAVGLVARSEHELATAGLLLRLRHQHAPTAAADPANRRALSQEEAIRRTYDPWSVRVTASDLQYDNVRRAER
jgi:NAD(P)-dependent dehydrogenase (short-subunit alcohol dehydrogenase family)